MSRIYVTIMMAALLTISTVGFSFLPQNSSVHPTKGENSGKVRLNFDAMDGSLANISRNWPTIIVDPLSLPDNGSFIDQDRIDLNISIKNGSDEVNGVIDFDGSLRAWWNFDNSSWDNGTYSAMDLINNSIGYVINDTTPVSEGRSGHGLRFDGDGDSLIIPYNSNFEFDDQITIEAWVNSSSGSYVISQNSSGTRSSMDDFERGFGNWSNVYGDDIDWRRDSGGTGSSSTGPNYDHTLGNTAGIYLYTEASGSNNRDAHLVSQEITLSGSNEKLEFWYHMYGSNMGTLSVEISPTPYTSWTTIWSRTGQQHSSSTVSYTKASISLSSYSGKYKIRFHGLTGDGFRSDMAIDDVELVAGSDDSPFGLTTFNGGEFFIDSRSINATGSTDINDGKWHHMMGSYDGYYLRLYVDGVRVGQNYHPGLTISSSSNNIVIGRHYDPSNSTGYLNGTIDDLKLHSRALSLQESKLSIGKNGGMDEIVPFTNLAVGSHSYRIIGQTDNGSLNCTSLQTFTRYIQVPNSYYTSEADNNGVTKADPQLNIEAGSSDQIDLMGMIDVEGTTNGWWRMESSSGGRISSQIGTSNNLVMKGDTRLGIGGVIGGYAYLDGIGDHLVGPGSVFLLQNSNASISLQFRSSSRGTLVSEGDQTSGWELKLDDLGRVLLEYGGTSNPVFSVRSINGYHDGEWHHLVAIMSTSSTTLEANSADIYLDGIKVTTTTMRTGYYNRPISGIIAGAGSNGTSSFFKGCIDELILYQRPIGRDEIQNLRGDSNSMLLGQIIMNVTDGTHRFQCLFQNSAGIMSTLNRRSVTIEYFTTEVTIPRTLWRSDVTYHLRRNIYPDQNNKVSIINSDLVFDLHGNIVDCNRFIVGVDIFGQSNITLHNGTIHDTSVAIQSNNVIGIKIFHMIIKYSDIAIWTNQTFNSKIEYTTISHCINGIIVRDSSTNCRIREMIGSSCSSTFIRIDGGDGHEIINATMDHCATGILISGVDGIEISGTNSNSGSKAINLEYCKNSTISNSTISSNYISAISLSSCTSNRIENNMISNCHNDGIVIDTNSLSNILKNITMNGINGNGIFIGSSNQQDLSEVFISGSGTGINVENGWKTSIVDCSLRENLIGIKISRGSSGTEIIGNDLISNSDHGISMGRSIENLIMYNTINKNGFGIGCFGCVGSEISNTSFSDNGNGIFLSMGSSNNRIIDNSIRDSTGFAIVIDSIFSWGVSENNKIIGNDLFGISQNGEQAMDNGRRNIWNGTGTGNYWSEWVAPDKEPDSIVDIPYFIPSASYFPADFYPLVDPIGSQRLYTPYNTTAYEDVEYSQRCFALNLGEDLLWDMKSNANWLTFNMENCLVGRPNEDDIGEFWINISVSGDLTSLWRNFTLWVQNTNDAPVIATESLPDLIEDEGFKIKFSVSDQDPTQDKCSFKMISDSDFIEIDRKEGIISGTPRNDDVGTHHLTLIVDDQRGGKDTRTFDIVVINSNDPPQIDTMISNTTCLEDNEFYLDLKGSDIDPTNDQLTWKMSTSCDFLVIDEDDGIIIGYPGNENVGKYSILINLSDGGGGYDEISFVLEVVNVNDPPEIINRPDPIVLIEDQWSEDILDIRSLFNDPEGDHLTFLVTSDGPLFKKISEDNILSLISMVDWSGDTEILIKASDGIASVDLTIPVKVLPENDDPTGLMIFFVDPAYHEGELGSMKAVATDPDITYGDSLTYQWSSDLSGDLGSGKELIVDLPHGIHVIKLTVSDSYGGSVNITSKLVVFKTPTDPISGGGDGGVDNLPTPGNVKIDPDRLVQEKSKLETFSVLFFLILAGLLLMTVIVQAILSRKKAKTVVE